MRVQTNYSSRQTISGRRREQFREITAEKKVVRTRSEVVGEELICLQKCVIQSKNHTAIYAIARRVSE